MLEDAPREAFILPDHLANLIGETWDAEYAQALELVRSSATAEERAEPMQVRGPIWCAGGDLARTSRRAGREHHGPAHLVAALVSLARLLLEREKANRAGRVNWVDVFVPVYLVSWLSGLSEDAIAAYRLTPGVRRWLSAREWNTALDGDPVAGGMVWRVRLSPVGRGHAVGDPAPEHLRHGWRSLEGDRANRRTRYGITRWISDLKSRTGCIEKALRTECQRATLWFNRTPLSTPKREGTTVLSIPATYKHRAGRKLWVEDFGVALCASLGDLPGPDGIPRSLNFMRSCGWTVLKGDVYGNARPRKVILWALEQVRQARERTRRKLTNPGAFFVAQLRRAGWFEMARSLEPLRVA